MIQGIGTDIISINRIAQLKNKEAFIKKILSQQEIAVYETFKSPKRQQEFLAGRFAAKEALYKALGARCEGYEYTDFVILNEVNGAPYLAAPLMKGIHLSISHCEEYATAFAIFEQ